MTTHVPLNVPRELSDLPVEFLRTPFLASQFENARANGHTLTCLRTEWCVPCRSLQPLVFELRSVAPRFWATQCQNPKHPRAA